MSYNPNNVNIQHNALTLEDYLMTEKLKAQVAWYAPNVLPDRDPEGTTIYPETIHLGGTQKPTWETPVMHVGKLKESMDLYRKGSKNLDQATHSPFIYDESYGTKWGEMFDERAKILTLGKSYLNSPFRQASGVMTSGDFPALNVIQLLGDVLGQDNRTYTLDQAVTRVATPNLVLHIDQWSGISGSLDVGEAVEPFVKKGAYSRTEYMLKKQGIAIAITDEAAMRYERDVWGQHVTAMGTALTREINQKIATELELGASAGTFGDWLAWTTDHRTRDASRDIYTASAIIRANGGNPNTVASHPRVLNDFMVNTGGPMAAAQQQRIMPGVVQVPLLQGYTWYTDDLKTATLATVYDKEAVVFMEGPTKSEQWRQPGPMINRYQIVAFNQVKIVDATRIRNVLGVSAA